MSFAQLFDAHWLLESQAAPSAQVGLHAGGAHLFATQLFVAHSPLTAHAVFSPQVGEQL